ncbi:MAG: BamA/TamA family outer membrane protein [Bacteroidota bacterium]
MRILKIFLISFSLISSLAFANENDSSAVSVNTLPFGFYSNSLGWVFGSFTSIKGYPQKNSFTKAGGIISTNGSKYVYLQADEVQNPLFKRQFIRPDIFVGKLGDVKEYIGLPDANGIVPGSNSSREEQHLLLHGTDYWFELNLKHLLPIGKGIEKDFDYVIDIRSREQINEPVLNIGKVFFETKLIYRDMTLKNNFTRLKLVTSAIDFSLSNDNTNYIYFPTYGTYQKVSYIKQFNAFGCDVPADIWKADFRCFYPIFDGINSFPTVIAFNFVTMDTPSWDEKFKGKYKRGKLFVGPTLGGTKYLRGYKDLRFHDRAMLYYSLELRKNLDWNPFNYYEWTRKIGIDVLQLALFGDLGRVAPEWDFAEFHQNMRYTYGLGLRAFMQGMVLRMDVGKSKENIMIQMFVENPF